MAIDKICGIDSSNHIKNCIVSALEKIWPGNNLENFLLLLLLLSGIYLLIRQTRREKKAGKKLKYFKTFRTR